VAIPRITTSAPHSDGGDIHRARDSHSSSYRQSEANAVVERFEMLGNTEKTRRFWISCETCECTAECGWPSSHWWLSAVKRGARASAVDDIHAGDPFDGQWKARSGAGRRITCRDRPAPICSSPLRTRRPKLVSYTSEKPSTAMGRISAGPTYTAGPMMAHPALCNGLVRSDDPGISENTSTATRSRASYVRGLSGSSQPAAGVCFRRNGNLNGPSRRTRTYQENKKHPGRKRLCQGRNEGTAGPLGPHPRPLVDLPAPGSLQRHRPIPVAAWDAAAAARGPSDSKGNATNTCFHDSR